jgi:hypothetical protein
MNSTPFRETCRARDPSPTASVTARRERHEALADLVDLGERVGHLGVGGGLVLLLLSSAGGSDGLQTDPVALSVVYSLTWA